MNMPVPHEKRKEYMAAYIRKHYRENRQYYLDKAAKRRDQITEHIRNAKDKPCKDCGIKYPYYVMDFDHLDEKLANIAGLARMGWSIKRIDTELAKCDVVCSNCHRKRTHKRLALVV